MAFETIIGNKEVKELLEDVIKTRNFLHSYLFTGIDGIGKMIFAKEFAKNILCKTKNSCEMFDGENHPDFTVITPDGNSIKVEQIRLLQNKIAEKPIESTNKVCIINDSELMTKEAQNCLLKTLEEPPEYMIIILICANEEQLLNTIKSRCTKILFKPIEDKEIKKYIENKGVEEKITDSMLDLLDGSIGKTVKVLEKRELLEKIEPIFTEIENCDKIEMMQRAEALYKSKDDIEDVLSYANVILLKKAKKDAKYLNCIKLIEKAKIRLKQNANFDMTIDNMLFSIWEEINEDNNRC